MIRRGLLAFLPLASAALLAGLLALPSAARGSCMTTVTDGTKCGYETITDGAKCGYNVVSDGAKCGWANVSDFASCTVKHKGDVTKCRTAKSCNGTPKSCNGAAKSCSQVNASCDPMKKVHSSIKKLIPDEKELAGLLDTAATEYKSVEAKVKTGLAMAKGYSAAEKKDIHDRTVKLAPKMKSFVTTLKTNWDKVHKDPANQPLLKRLVSNMYKKKVNDEVRTDMEKLGNLMGMLGASSIAPKSKWALLNQAPMWQRPAGLPFGPPSLERNGWAWADGPDAPGATEDYEVETVAQSSDLPGSFFIQIAASGGIVAGAEANVGFTGNCFKNSGEKYGVAGYVGVGGILGAVEGVAAGIAFGWQPGGVDRSGGGSLGVGFGAAYIVGGKATANWNMPPSTGIPGVGVEIEVGVGPAAGLEVEAEVAGGYTWSWTN
jgi:hypothetical protein